MTRALLLLLPALTAALAAPRISGIDPPNWWPGHGINPVRLLIRGSGLASAKVEAGCAGTAVSRAQVNAAGTYAFADLRIRPSAVPGPCPIRVVTPEGRAEASFSLIAPLAPAGRFQGLSPDDVVYLIMPDRFADGDPANNDPALSRGLYDPQKPRYYHGGDFAGIRRRLPYLKELGVTAIWLNPVYDNANRLNERETYGGQPITDYHGYGAVNFYRVEEHFGTLGQLRELIDDAHRFGIKVIQDQVANHTGPYHPWVQNAPTPAWYNGTEARHLANTWQTWTLADPYATAQTRKATLEGWFIDILPDLNQNDPEVARYLIQNSLWWVGAAGFDAIRQDTLPYVPRQFWRDWTAALKAQYPRLRTIGEAWDADPALVAFFQGGRAQFDGIDTGIDTVFDFPLYFAIRKAFAAGGPLRDLAIVLSHDRLYPHPELLVTFLGSHDVARFMSEPGATVSGLKLAQTFLITVRGTPLLYYGDEIAMLGGPDPDNRRDFPAAAFERAGRTPEQQEVFEHVRRLARIRARCEPLRRGKLVELADSGPAWVYARVSPAGAALAAFNNTAESATIETPVAPAGLRDGVILHDALGGAPDLTIARGTARVSLAPRSAAIYTP